jgi:D-threo-aldose 1-dehydrogenase
LQQKGGSTSLLDSMYRPAEQNGTTEPDEEACVMTATVRELGRTGLEIPPIVFGTSALGNLYQAYSEETKLAILREMVASTDRPVVLDCAGKYGAGLALETIGNGLRSLGVPPEKVIISNKLAWVRTPLRGREPTFERGVWFGLKHDAEQAISYQGILRCWEQGCELLGAPYQPRLVSVHDPDEGLNAAADPAARQRLLQDIVGAYRALHELKRQGQAGPIGVGAKDWRVVRELADLVDLDWVMLACSLTIFHHPPEVVALVASLHQRGIGIINSAVFHAGFLTGGKFFDYRELHQENPADKPLFAWRDRFHALCRQHDVLPAAACVRFAMSPPGVAAIALNTSRPEQVQRNRDLASVDIPAAFWAAMKDARLISPDYPYLG